MHNRDIVHILGILFPMYTGGRYDASFGQNWKRGAAALSRAPGWGEVGKGA